jgi:hypothetical protein
MSDNQSGMVSEPVPPKRAWTAQRLLLAVGSQGQPTIEQLAQRIKVSESVLVACRDGARPLEPQIQMMLAAAVVELAPAHSRLAHRLYGQAQAALRMALDSDRCHPNYAKTQFR